MDYSHTDSTTVGQICTDLPEKEISPEPPLVTVEYDYYAKTDVLKDFEAYRDSEKKDKIPWFNKEKNCLNKLNDIHSYNTKFLKTSKKNKDSEPQVLYEPFPECVEKFERGNEKHGLCKTEDCEEHKTMLPNVIFSARKAPWTKDKKTNPTTARQRRLREKILFTSSSLKRCPLPFDFGKTQDSGDSKKKKTKARKKREDPIPVKEEYVNSDEETLTDAPECEQNLLPSVIPSEHHLNFVEESENVKKYLNEKTANKPPTNPSSSCFELSPDSSVISEELISFKEETFANSPSEQSSQLKKQNAMIEAMKNSELLLSTYKIQNELNKVNRNKAQTEKEIISNILLVPNTARICKRMQNNTTQTETKSNTTVLPVPETCPKYDTKYKAEPFVAKNIFLPSNGTLRGSTNHNKGRRRKISSKIADLIEKINISNITAKTDSVTNRTYFNQQKNIEPAHIPLQKSQSRTNKPVESTSALPGREEEVSDVLELGEKYSDNHDNPKKYDGETETWEDRKVERRTCCGVMITIALLGMVLASLVWLVHNK
ncbi:uncharacterized protein LOC119672518 isoform X2 [Teleopsis dalmanni]|uniref:uncharacterized protein LOC119672518 isoform X2 n=1 Tax=Teleopsis dalmanni TaxID=139649 RepID=UPI0018CD5640|nr:uncharacterized protein LOC119672518 isoform X2 [Teleopsis dalmanni]